MKKFCKTIFFFKIEIFKIQNFKKIPSFTISFLVFQHFWHFVFYFTYPNLSKNYGIFCSVLLEGLEIFYQRFLKDSKSSFKKILICQIFFFQNSMVYYLFFYFFIIFDILFSISPICICQKNVEIFMLFVLWIRDFIKDFWKIMEYFSQKYRHLKSKILYNSIIYYLFFFLFFQHFGNLFFLFHISKLVKKS